MQAKSRTRARPAFWNKISPAIEKSIFLLAPAVYIFAVLVLCQYFLVQIALGFYGNPAIAEILPTASVGVRQATSQAEKTQTGTRAKIGLPVRITIPSIRVNAIIRNVGLTSDGSMGTPKIPSETAWYMFGPKPGEKGSAVIAGHVNWYNGAKGAFERIKTLKRGDVITIRDDNGLMIPFAVREVRILGEKEDASSVFRSYDGKSHLNLVTCSGIWNKARQSYSKRLVVFADKILE